MSQNKFQFPEDFLWGSATSSHQVEGGNTNNNWWAWENEPGRIKFGHKSGLACDWWGGRWQEDFDRAKEGGQNAHRFSLEWSRIQPKPDQWDAAALDVYVQMLRGLRQRGMTPLVTLHHFSDPLWLAEMGGWENPAVCDLFRKYTEKVVPVLKEHVNLWCTINEPNVDAISAYVFGDFPPGKKGIASAYRAMVNMVRAHAYAYKAIHALQPEAQVGFALHWRDFYPANPASALDRWAARMQSQTFNESFACALRDGVFRFIVFQSSIPEAAGTQDYIGLNYYTRDLVSFDLSKAGELFARRYYAPGVELSGTDYIASQPEGFYNAMQWCAGFGLPIYITENGVEDAEDKMRPRYLVRHIQQVGRALNAGLPIKGYFHWSLVDNFEWERGWTQRFGLWELDVETQARRKRRSVNFFAALCQANALTPEIVAEYTPEIQDEVFA